MNKTKRFAMDASEQNEYGDVQSQQQFAADEPVVEEEFVTPGQSRLSVGTLLLLGAFAAGGILLYYLGTRPTPKIATAKDKKIEDKANRVIAELALEKSEKTAKANGRVGILKDTEELISAFFNYPAKTQLPPEQVKKNPFVHKKPRSVDPDDATAAELQAARRRQAEEKARKQRQQQIQKALSYMKLQMVMYGSRPAAMISGKMVRVGETIEFNRGASDEVVFTVTEIRPRAVTLECDKHKYNLQIK